MPQSAQKITQQIRIPQEKISSLKESIKNLADLKNVLGKLTSTDVSDALEVILGCGINLDVSDIHLEPSEKTAKLRFRVDGILQEVTSFDSQMYGSLLSRLKLLSEIKLNISDRPQDGRFSIVTDILIEVRVSSLPAEHGESLVLRILNPKSLISLQELGLRKDLLEIFEKEIAKPNGMIIVTGPTGSGKTTTLYAFLKRIQNPGIKIITIEDPIEYHLDGISQTQTAQEKGYDFASGLKSIMRQDPDVILVGEIRDLETAEIGLQAALTGHLVLSTLHTNDAAGTVARLTSLGAKISNVAPALNMAIAQRLVRKVCKDCSTMITPSATDLKKIKRALENLSQDVSISLTSEGLKISKPNGCQICNFTGYKGRSGIYETIVIDDEMENFILTTPSIVALKKEAIRKGMITMYQDGLIKVLQGETTIEEVERATGAE